MIPNKNEMIAAYEARHGKELQKSYPLPLLRFAAWEVSVLIFRSLFQEPE